MRQLIRDSDRLREIALRILCSRRLNHNVVYNALYRKWIERRARKGLERPESVDIESSSFCNARCIMCAHLQMTRPKGNMAWETFEKVAREAVAWEVPKLFLSGFGEAFLDKQLLAKIRFAKDIGARWVCCLTNGSLLSPDRIEEILTSGLDELSISMDGFSRETFNHIRVGLDFDRIVEGLNQLLEKRKGPKPRIVIQVVLLPENSHEKQLAKNRWAGRVDALVFRQAQGWAGSYSVDSKIFTPHTVENNKLVPCRYLWTQLNVRNNGDVVLCCIDWDSRKVVGNVHQQSLREIWRGPLLQQVRRLHLEGRSTEEPLCRACSNFSVWW